MKIFLLFVILFSVSSYAKKDPLLKVVEQFGELEQRLNYDYCNPTDRKYPGYCKDLYKYVCSIEKKSNKVEQLENSLVEEFWVHHHEHDEAEYRKISKQVIDKSEASVFEPAIIKKEDIRAMFDTSRKSILNFLSNTSFIPDETVGAMKQKITQTKFFIGSEYVEDLVQEIKLKSPKYTDEETRTFAYRLYFAACGRNGLDRNAFYTDGRVVLCPGLIHSLSDYHADTKQILAALSFTIGHELGHSIDSDHFPEAYKEMGDCYINVSKDKDIWSGRSGGENSSDYWGTMVLYDNLKVIPDLEDRAKVIAYSVDGFCESPGLPEAHASGKFRINQTIRNNQLVAESLRCAPPTKKKPFCSLRGAFPNK